MLYGLLAVEITINVHELAYARQKTATNNKSVAIKPFA